MRGDPRALRPFAPPWSAPEQAYGAGLGRRADLYSIGVVALFLLTGRAPAPDGSALELAQALEPAWSSFFESALAADPAARFPSALAMRRALRETAGMAHVALAARPGGRGPAFAPDPGSSPTLPFAQRPAGTGTVFSVGPATKNALPFGGEEPKGTGTV